ncbi:proteinase-activated receptor 2-like isoform X2 [Mastacembelus armatus]|uniref:proteinase-activated receptor 2-like isoform X2 n=1 Tax=Mastacembelus armatus TaxID=205130 RepID=UPI000E462351|nr:proteinase-activated receptor 2-like isoform X2 [Mastacembelus armatus]
MEHNPEPTAYVIQRYYQILHRDKWAKVTRIWQRLLLSSVWLLGALVALPVVFLLRDVNTEDEKTDGHSCNKQRIAPEFELVYIFFIVFSQLVLLSFYILLVRGLKRAQMPDKKQPKVDQLFIRIIAIFLACSVFPLIFRMLYVAEGFTKSDKLHHVSKMLTFVECFYFINHCLNPFLYFFASRYHKRHSSNRRKHLFDDEF